MSESRLSRALGAYLGLAVGDALGAPVEFLTRREIACRGGHREMTGGGWLKLKPGQVTDDTEMCLCLGRALLGAGGWNARLAAEQFAAWLRHHPVDIGNTCRRGIRRFLVEGTLEGPPNEGDGGNGAAMRVLPVALATFGQPALFARAALEQAHLTHHHPLSDAATLALGHMVQTLLDDRGREGCRKHADALVAAHPQFRFAPYRGRASGYIVDTLQTVLHHFFAFDDFEECLVETVNRGEDADTNGAIVGMLAGALHGVEAIPRRWISSLDRGVRHEIGFQAKALLELSAGSSGAG